VSSLRAAHARIRLVSLTPGARIEILDEAPFNGPLTVRVGNQTEVIGHDLASIDVGAIRRQCAVVLQQSRLLAGDIFTNIVGASPLTLDDAWRAAELAGLADDIRAMPMGMHTVVSEGGSTLSGGQRQRLLIARALVRKPRVVFFDEATSALDNRSQEIVTRSLEEMRASRIVIAHRLTTVQRADRIFVMAGGRIVQQGHFEELLEVEGLFQQLAARQLV